MDITSRQKKVKVVGLCGSLRMGSYTMMMLKLAIQKAVENGADAQVLDLSVMTLPFCNGEENYPDYPDVDILRQTVKQADALILATPEYHGSVSGVLKNVLDLMSFDELAGKVYAPISILGGAHNSNALNHLRLIIRQVHGWVIPEQLAVGSAYKMFDADGDLTDSKLKERLDKLVMSLIEAARRLRS